MTEKRIPSYVVQKHDIEVNWNASSLVPEKGQLVVYDIEVDAEGTVSALPEGRIEPYTYERFKIGDGIRTVKDLPFTGEIYIGDGDMPEGVNVQIVLDAEDEEENLMNQLEEYVDSKVEEGLSSVDTKIENSVNELDAKIENNLNNLNTEDIKYSVEGSFVHQEGFDGTLHQAIYDITNAIGNNYGYSQEALYNVNELSENMDSMGQSFGNALWSEEYGIEPRVSELEALLGYESYNNDIVGLSADFENNYFMRLAGAKNLEAGEAFNKFPVYRDRVRCNVKDDGTITALYGDKAEEDWETLVDGYVEFEKMGAPDDSDDVGGTCAIEESINVPHILRYGAKMKITIQNTSLDGEVTEIISSLGIPGDTQRVHGTFIDSRGRNVNLCGFQNGGGDSDHPTHYSSGFYFFVYPYTPDQLVIRVEIDKSALITEICDPYTGTLSKMGSDEQPDDTVQGNIQIMPEYLKYSVTSADFGKTIAFEIQVNEWNKEIVKGTFAAGGTDYVYGTFIDNNNKTHELSALYDENSGFVIFANPYFRDEITIKIYFMEESGGYKEDGSNGQVMVYQPAFYYRTVPVKLEKQENGIGYHIRKANYYISSTPKSGFKLHPAFYDKNGKPLRYLLYSAYESILPCEGMNDADRLTSIVGVVPQACGLMIGDAMAYAKVRGENWYIEDMQSIAANQLLMMIEYGQPNVHSLLGKGLSWSDLATGSTSYLGNASGVGDQTDSNGDKAISYRGMENPYGNISKYVEGIHLERVEVGKYQYKPFIDNTEHRFNDRIGDDFCQFTMGNNVANEYASAFGYGSEEYDWLFIPSEFNGNSNYPIGSDVAFNSDVSDEWGSGQLLSYIHSYGTLFGSENYDTLEGYGGAGCRLIYLPVNTDDNSIVA